MYTQRLIKFFFELDGFTILSLLCLVSCIILLIPLFFDIKIGSSHDFIEDLNNDSGVIRASFAVVLAISIPLLTDVISDHFSQINNKRQIKENLFIFERYVMIFSFISHPIAYYLGRLYFYESIGEILYIIGAVRNTILSYIHFVIILTSSTKAWNVSNTSLYFSLIAANRIFHTFRYLHHSIFILEMAIIPYSFISSFRVVILKYLPNINLMNELGSKPTNEYIVILSIITLTLGVTTQILIDINIMQLSGTELEAKYISTSNIFIILVTIPMIQVPNRVNRILLKSAEAKLEAKTAYISYVEYNLKIPLKASRHRLQIFSEEHSKLLIYDQFNNDLKLISADIQNSLSTALVMLEDISTIDKLDSKLLQLSKTKTNFSEFVVNCLDLFRVNAKKKKIIFDLNGCLFEELNFVFVSIDRPKINQVIRNLVSNALKFTPLGGKISVNLRFINSEIVKKSTQFLKNVCGLLTCRGSYETKIIKYIRFEIKDSGIGMQSDLSEKLFAEDSIFLRQNERITLGLEISKKLVYLHDGRIGAYSPGRNQGSLFYFDIPLDDQLSYNQNHDLKPKKLSIISEETPSKMEESNSSQLLIEIERNSNRSQSTFDNIMV